MIKIIRNHQEFGSYDFSVLLAYVKNGQILLCDQAKDTTTGEINSVRYFLRKYNQKVLVDHKGGLIVQLKNIGYELIIPKTILSNKQWISDKRLLLLALIGLCPSIMMILPLKGFSVFYLISLYFAVVWGLFFYYFFKTNQVNTKTTLLTFFATQIMVFLLWDMIGLPSLNPFYLLIDSTFPINMFGYVCGVGLTEELVKLIPLIIICYKSKEPLIPQTIVYYGLISGIAFGVFEGVQYQMGVNSRLDYSISFFMNIARLTSLPFIHAIWCGIAGYFISFANIYPKYRVSLYFLAIVIPSIIHGLYDTFCGSYIGMVIALPITFIGVIMLMTYLKQGVDYQSKLRN